MVGYFYLVPHGPGDPRAVLIPLWLIWLGLAALLVRLAVRRSWWTPAVPLAAAVLFVLVLVVGEQAFDGGVSQPSNPMGLTVASGGVLTATTGTGYSDRERR